MLRREADHRDRDDGCPAVFVPDNLRSAVTHPCRYEPEVNRSYADLARFYSAVVIPARVRKPKDKAKAEAGVLLAQRWIDPKNRTCARPGRLGILETKDMSGGYRNKCENYGA